MIDKSVQPLVSIVIPHFNRPDLLAETLRSVKMQKYTNWEVVVVDDGSESEIWVAVQGLQSQKIRVLQRTDGLKGPSRCRNIGATAAKGKYVVFLDSDDLLASWCLSQRLEKVRAAPENDLWVFQVLLFGEDSGDGDICWNQLSGTDDLGRFLRSDPPWHTSSPIWQRQAFLDLGGFNEKVFYGDDADLHIKALLQAVSYRKYPDCLPDIFIRRGHQPRITGGFTQDLAESRRVRLIEGKRLLHKLGASEEAHACWEGQFFVECEELLFNANRPKQPIENVLKDWVALHRLPWFRRKMVRSYLNIGMLFRDRVYFAVRVARRLARMVLPRHYFPTGGNFQNWRLGESVMQQVHRRLLSDAPEAMPAQARKKAPFPQTTARIL